MSEPDATLEPFEVRMYEVYAVYCDNNGLKPSVSDYMQWLEEKYGYELDNPEPAVPDEVYIEAKIEEAERLRDGLREDGIAV